MPVSRDQRCLLKIYEHKSRKLGINVVRTCHNGGQLNETCASITTTWPTSGKGREREKRVQKRLQTQEVHWQVICKGLFSYLVFIPPPFLWRLAALSSSLPLLHLAKEKEGRKGKRTRPARLSLFWDLRTDLGEEKCQERAKLYKRHPKALHLKKPTEAAFYACKYMGVLY